MSWQWQREVTVYRAAQSEGLELLLMAWIITAQLGSMQLSSLKILVYSHGGSCVALCRDQSAAWAAASGGFVIDKNDDSLF